MTHSFVINVMSEGLYLAPLEYLIDYGYVSYKEMVPEVTIPKGFYEVSLEVLGTTRGRLSASGVFEIKSAIAVGDFAHVIPDDRWDTFDRDQRNDIMRGVIRNCASIYTGREGDYNVVLKLKEVY
jgi:hypothetical protein